MEIIAEKREKTGKKVKSIRYSGRLPAVVFGPDMDSINITVGKTEFKRVLNDAGETSLIDLNLGSNNHKVLVKDVQYDPISLDFMHIGFYKPNLTEDISADIPVEYVGEENIPLVKSKDALFLVVVDTIEVKALPTDLPKAFVVDVTKLVEVGDSITVADLVYDKEKIEIVGLEEDDLLAKLDYAEMEEEEVEVTEEEAVAGIEATEETAEEDEEETEEDK